MLLIWPAVIVGLVRGSDVERGLAIGSMTFLLVLGFADSYDPWQGRYFLSSAVLACPLASRFAAPRGRTGILAVSIAVALTCLSGVYTAIARNNAPLVPIVYGGRSHPAIWQMDFAAQLTRNDPQYTEATRRYLADVPRGATVADLLDADSFEFALFGPSLDRRIVPLGDAGVPALFGAGASCLVFSDRREKARPGDQHLGVDWWLRRLTTTGGTGGG